VASQVNKGYRWDKDAVAKGLVLIGDCRQEMLAILEDLLCKYHRKNISGRYADLIAGMWLEQYMQVTYAAWEQVRISPPLHGPEAPRLDLASTPQAYYDLCVYDHEYHYGLRIAIHRMLQGYEPVALLQKKNDKICHGDNLSKPTKPISSAVKEILRRFLFERIFSRTAKVLICAPNYKCDYKEWFLTLWKWRRWVRWDDLNEYISIPIDHDHEWRYNYSKEVASKRDFPGVLKALLPLCIPAVFLEGYQAFRTQVLSLHKQQPRIAYTATALDVNLTFKFLAAEWSQQGTILISHQHGGNYGMDKIHVIEDYETRVSDQFYTWGWSRDDRGVRPMSLGIKRVKRCKYSKQILLNCVEYPRNVHRLHFQPMPGTIENMIEDTIDFISLFPDQVNLVIRPYFLDYGWGLQEKMRQAAPEAKFDMGERRIPPMTQYARSRLVVHNYLGTSWLETLAMNIPTVCFFDPSAYEFRSPAESLVNRFIELGILHPSGRDAARFLADKMTHIEKWWLREELQEARKSFCANYANFSPDWSQQWESEFERLLGGEGLTRGKR